MADRITYVGLDVHKESIVVAVATRRSSGTVDSLRGFDRGVRGRQAIDPETAKAPGIRHADGGAGRQEAA